jgi:hypothetical protein
MLMHMLHMVDTCRTTESAAKQAGHFARWNYITSPSPHKTPLPFIGTAAQKVIMSLVVAGYSTPIRLTGGWLKTP